MSVIEIFIENANALKIGLQVSLELHFLANKQQNCKN